MQLWIKRMPIILIGDFDARCGKYRIINVIPPGRALVECVGSNALTDSDQPMDVVAVDAKLRGQPDFAPNPERLAENLEARQVQIKQSFPRPAVNLLEPIDRWLKVRRPGIILPQRLEVLFRPVLLVVNEDLA